MSLDPLTILGITLKRHIETGEPFVEWLLDANGLPALVDALHNHSDAADTFFFWDEVASAISDLSHQLWQPLPAYVQSLYVQQGGTVAITTEAAA